ncbi:Cytochrome P450 [Popillia japonica]|uniref:Cytochrome P450 n=1 Tax=Popillia japonica TaxID=7064 RepID=A0AAW1HS13_POPJA
MFYVLLVVSCVLYLLYRYLNRNYDYWAKRHAPFDPPVTFFGNFRDAITFKRSLGEIYTDMYNSYKDVPYVGFYKIRQPALLIREPEIIKDILTTDFNSFAKNDAVVDEDVDPIAAKNPFFQYGANWKTSRSRLSYCFSSGKMKHMFPLMQDVSKNMVKYIETETKLGANPFDVKELCSKFTSDNVANCAFGLEGKAFEDPNSEFRSIGKKVLQPSLSLTIKMLLIFLFPNLAKIFTVRFIPEDAADYFRNLVKNSIQYRKENNIVRNDFLGAVLQMKFKPEEAYLTNDDITAHAPT